MSSNPRCLLQIILALAVVSVSPGCDPQPDNNACGARNTACCAGGYCKAGLLCDGTTCVDDPSLQSSDAGSMAQIPTSDLLMSPPDMATPPDLATSSVMPTPPDLATPPDLTKPDPRKECSDRVKDGNETDIDCGGGVCPACAEGRGCVTDNDCQSAYCGRGVCRMPTCKDGVKNGMETDVDCGGPSCPAC